MENSVSVWIALGTNLGRREQNLSKARQEINRFAEIQRVSMVYETDPWGFEDQDAFLNQVIMAETELAPDVLLERLKQLEIKLGREATFRYGPRLIDLDILFYAEQVVEMDNLQIPHPRIAERAFVLAPLADISPDYQHPVSKLSIKEMLSGLDTSTVRVFNPGGNAVNQQALLDWGQKTFVMGILNVTPDSFSGDGLLKMDDLTKAAMAQAQAFIQAGAHILDIGGESTRPGAELVSLDDELSRVVPVIEAIRTQFPQMLISIDTYKARVAEQALKAGADWINDVWGFKADDDMANVAASSGAPVILMHNRSKPAQADLQEKLGGRYIGVDYDDLLQDVKRELMESVELARSAGVKDNKIILDPGIGFGKTVEQNLDLLNRIDEICELGFPVLLGPSRKSFIGYTLDLPADERVEGTAATICVGITRGVDIVRVHDVQEMSRVARMTDAIVRRG